MAYCTYNLIDGSITIQPTIIGSILSSPIARVEKLPNSWYRVSLSAFCVSTAVGIGIDCSNGSIPSVGNGGSPFYAGNGTSGIFVWGAQFENTPYPTSYIPTTTATITRAADVSSSAVVTRAADTLTVPTSKFLNPSGGSILVETETLGNNSPAFSLNDGTAFNEAKVLVYPTAGGARLVTSDIVRDGLVLNLDAGNPASYPGTGTTWTDLSGNGNNGTLVNGVGYSSDNGGSLVFDGVNDYSEITTRNTNLEFQPLQPYSVFCWVYNLLAPVNEGTGTGAIISNMTAPPHPGWDLWRNSSTTIAGHLISNWSGNAVKVGINFNYTENQNKWVYIGYTYNGTSPTNATDSLNSMNFYINGVLSTSGKQNFSNADGFNTSTEIISYNSSQRLRIASRWNFDQWYQGSPLTISNTQIYNRQLTASEIQQNYNALRSRFLI
jgi:hypothetical protein